MKKTDLNPKWEIRVEKVFWEGRYWLDVRIWNKKNERPTQRGVRATKAVGKWLIGAIKEVLEEFE